MDDYLSISGRYIYITPNYKIINPAHESIIYKYSGEISNFDFKNQTKNYNEIQKKLSNKLCYIYAGKIIGEKRIKLSFIAHNNDRSIFWHKYEGKIDGDSENVIYENNKKYKLSKWLKI